ncbi:MAG: hypothetical protein K5894_08100 [Lachnospiraceae bacterium]|nr:hypothetical protein [Lachnospiraceae bacterium]
MKRIKNKKLIIISFLFLFAVSAIGWGKKSVELLNKDLLNLDKAIDAAEWGSDDLAANENEIEDENDSESTKNNNSAVSSNTVNSETIKIRINGKRIFVNGEECSKEEIEKKLRVFYSGKEMVRIFDDYAEAHVYRAVDEILTELSNSMGFEYYEGN